MHVVLFGKVDCLKAVPLVHSCIAFFKCYLFLQAGNQQLKLKQLQTALMDQALAKHPKETSRKQALKAELLQSLSSSSKFNICGKAVSLAH